MNKRIFWGIICLSTFAILWSLRYFSFNQRIREVYSTPQIIFRMKETVDYGDNIINKYKYKGYSIRVEEAKVLSFEEFINIYNLERGKKQFQEETQTYPAEICLIKIILTNNENHSQAVNISDFQLFGDDTLLRISDYIIDLNPSLELDSTFSIQPSIGESVSIDIPYILLSTAPENVENGLSEYNLYMELTHFPQNIIVKIQ